MIAINKMTDSNIWYIEQICINKILDLFFTVFYLKQDRYKWMLQEKNERRKELVKNNPVLFVYIFITEKNIYSWIKFDVHSLLLKIK